MIMTRRTVLCVLLVPCVFALAHVAPAQDDEGDKVEEAAPQNGVRVAQEIGPEVIDQWLFPQGNEKSARDFLETQLALRTEELQRLFQLSEAQVRKLQLAGRTEIKRLFDRIQEFRRKFQEQRMKRRARSGGQRERDRRSVRSTRPAENCTVPPWEESVASRIPGSKFQTNGTP